MALRMLPVVEVAGFDERLPLSVWLGIDQVAASATAAVVREAAQLLSRLHEHSDHFHKLVRVEAATQQAFQVRTRSCRQDKLPSKRSPRLM